MTNNHIEHTGGGILTHADENGARVFPVSNCICVPFGLHQSAITRTQLTRDETTNRLASRLERNAVTGNGKINCNSSRQVWSELLAVASV
jgi:hypothetical protein